MGLIKVKIDDAVEARFREKAMQRFGYAKGALSKAAQTAFQSWAGAMRKTNTEDPIKAVSGMLKNIKKSSVELQHEISKVWESNARN